MRLYKTQYEWSIDRELWVFHFKMGGLSNPRKQGKSSFWKRGNLYSESVTMVTYSVNLT